MSLDPNETLVCDNQVERRDVRDSMRPASLKRNSGVVQLRRRACADHGSRHFQRGREVARKLKLELGEAVARQEP